MLVYHLLNSEHGIDSIDKRRLKIATIKELNDPFELFGVNLSDETLRRAFHKMKDELSNKRGILCFSKSWHNPVLWSHYADKHKGLCLGFEIPDSLLAHVTYSRERLVVNTEKLKRPNELPQDIATQFLFTKYEHWPYEEEVRCFVELNDKDPTTELYFAGFSNNLELKSIIIGAQSSITRNDLDIALGDLRSHVTTTKARLAFNSFEVVKQKNDKLWV
jgi:hypothetical protein